MSIVFFLGFYIFQSDVRSVFVFIHFFGCSLLYLIAGVGRVPVLGKKICLQRLLITSERQQELCAIYEVLLVFI